MTGKEKCAILRELRNRIALDNGIDFRSSECTYTGECLGYCPKCDSEVRFLEEALKEKALKNTDVNFNSLIDVSVFDANPISDTTDEKSYATMGNMIVNDKVNLTDEELEAIIREYVVLPDENDNVTDVQGLLGDIIPDDFDDAW